ncbi:MAG: hypothetical protein JNM25_01735 [Planctomycetes bacterium]|nr:hypothetical protein [Planctomycetota bacterium]
MTSPTASLLQHLLTRSDLARLEVASTQVAAWLADGSLEPVAEVPVDDAAGEQVFSVADEALRAELGARLATIGKSAVLLSPRRIRSFLRRAADGGAGTAAAADTADVVADADVAALFAALVADLDGDLENVLRLAMEEADVELGPQAIGARPAEEAITEESMLRDNPIVLADSDVATWFRDGEFGAAPTGSGAPLDDLVPVAGEDLEELAATVAFHSEQLERLVDLPHALEDLAREVERIRAALEVAGALPPAAAAEGATDAAANPSPAMRTGQRTSLMAICLALLCWSGLVWFGTGSATLALSSFLAATVIGYLALQPATWRR